MKKNKKYGLVFLFIFFEYVGLRFITETKYHLLSIEPTIDIFMYTNRLATIAFISYMLLVAAIFAIIFLRDRHFRLNHEYASFLEDSLKNENEGVN